MPVRDHLLQIQRNLYDRFRSSAKQSVGDLSPALRKYFLEYQREFTDYTGLSSRSELVQAFIESDILICGDYHTLHQAQRTALHLLREAVEGLRQRGRRPVLALEMLSDSHTKAAAKYLCGEWEEKRFLDHIGYAQNWGFAWENYRPLFELARTAGVSIVGLSLPRAPKKPSLHQRDRQAARVLAKLTTEDPKVSILALMGDLHLAQGHLPAALEREWRSRAEVRRVVVVHQNPERLYWKLASRGLEHQANVLKLAKDVYCVMNTPPWVKLQSYLRWLEWTSDSEESETVPEPKQLWYKGSIADDFQDLLRTIGAFVEAEAGDVPFEIVWKESDLPKASGGLYRRRFRQLLVRAVGSYTVPGTNSVFLASPSVNTAATQAAICLHAHLSGRWKQFEFPKQDFYPAVWIEALGYLGSQIINPHRRCYGPQDFKDGAASNPVARFVDEHFTAEKRTGRFRGVKLPARVSPDRAVHFYRAARCLGQVLGAALYAAVVSNRVRATELLALFHNPFTDGKKARALYLGWVARLDREGLREAIRRDRW